jgi:hypothetical protein
MLVWSSALLTILFLACTDLRLDARGQIPIESKSLWIMLVAQTCIVSMLFPWLMRTAPAAVFVFLSGILTTQLAGLLGQNDQSQTFSFALSTGGWHLGLALWSGVLRTRRAELIAVAIASGIVAGGWSLLYLQIEFTDRSSIPTPQFVSLALVAHLVVAGIVRMFAGGANSTTYPQKIIDLSTST